MSIRSRSTFALLVVAVVAVPVRAGNIPYQACGELVDSAGFPPCLIHVADDGTIVRPDDVGIHKAGDRVLVEGNVDPNFASICNGSLVANLAVTNVERCLAECGTLSDAGAGCVRFDSDRGGSFVLQNNGGFTPGARVFVQGFGTDGEIECNGGMLPFVSSNGIQSCFEATGRIVPSNGCNSVLTASGERFEIEVTSEFGPGDYVTVQGFTDPEFLGFCGLPYVQRNSIRAAFGGTGVLIESENCGLVFEADEAGLAQRYAIDQTSGFVAGDEVVVTGRINDDCDLASTCGLDGCIETNSIGALFKTCGILEFGPADCAVLNVGPEEAAIPLEYFGQQPFGSRIFVAGTLSNNNGVCGGSDETVLRHNLALPCVDICGTFESGFECTPLLFGDDGQIYWLENTNDIPIDPGDRVRVLGGRGGACTTFCPFTCLRANDVLRCENVLGDINGDGSVDVEDIAGFVRVLLGQETDPLLVELSDVNFDSIADGKDVYLFTLIVLGEA